MIVSARTDTGKIRTENQDSFETGELPDGAYAVVCDGMGGAAGGATASSLAASVFASAFCSAFRQNQNSKGRSLKSMLTVCADKANAAVYDLASKEKELSGMGTTIVAAVALEKNLSIVHAGDSRAYLFRDCQLSQLTRDHSMVQNLIDDGYINEEQAQHHMYKNLITRALGTEPYVKVDFNEYEIESGDIILLCTDGLTNFVENEQIIEILKSEKPESAAEVLVQTANENGGGDNITAVIMSN